MAARRRTAKSTSRKKPSERVGLGGGSVDKHLSRPKAKKQDRWAQIGDGNTIIVRAIDTKRYFKDGQVHPVVMERKDGSTYKMDVMCLDQDDKGVPCPGCRDELERRFKFWMLVIVRDAEKTNKSGKVIGEEDQVRILSGANRLVKALNTKHKKRDLEKRDIEISQSGEGFEVEYEVDWADDEDNELTKADQRLVKEATEVKEAFKRYTTVPDEEDFFEPPGSDKDDDDDDDVGSRSVRRGSAFNRERKKGTSKRRSSRDDDDEDDDEDDEDERPRRRSSSRKASSKPKGALAKKAVTRSKSKRRHTR